MSQILDLFNLSENQFIHFKIRIKGIFKLFLKDQLNQFQIQMNKLNKMMNQQNC
ncbi:unnamed protein product [Paramecium sonneborni]|uniref:Uncharacterized protein n=1 Tax=Paramecium sonneborni TaxID=65129 RepID=A0A8S1PCC9_9CILI|nr:unnamed protein product [Paramecium sonneborni]